MLQTVMLTLSAKRVHNPLKFLLKKQGVDIGVTENIQNKVVELENQIKAYQLEKEALEEKAEQSYHNYLNVLI